jgi:hypothetical protein
VSRPRRSEVLLALTAVVLGAALTAWLMWLVPDHPLLMVPAGYTAGLLLVLLGMDVASRRRIRREKQRIWDEKVGPVLTLLEQRDRGTDLSKEN